ncbi:hypothetical protein [Microbacterium phyllosphaerae]|uniref:hypothetical protein n=1 Tax=Microbacterium phyllosphaerae TaxID=124798 RepID=UPI003D651DC0
MSGLVADGAVDLRFAHNASESFLLVTGTAARLRWDRGQAVSEHALLLLARTGAMAVAADGPVMRRGTSIALVVAGSGLVDVEVTESRNEFIALRVPAHLVSAAVGSARFDMARPPIPWRRLAPLYAFMHGVCATPSGPVEESDVISLTAEAIVAACVRTVVEDLNSGAGLAEVAMTFIAEHHRDLTVNASSLAGRLGVPTRTLQTAFAAAGTTARSELRSARVAALVLLQADYPHLTQSERARLAGFASRSAMYRALNELSATELGSGSGGMRGAQAVAASSAAAG